MSAGTAQATLNILCSICSEYYKEADVIYSTVSCGHLFHLTCLMNWLRRSKTCPQCRTPCHKRTIHKVHLNYSQPQEGEEDYSEHDMSAAPNWIIMDEEFSGEGLPKGVLKMGTDISGRDTYVARYYYRDDLLPAAYEPINRGAFASYGCVGHFFPSSEYLEVLILSDALEAQWVPDRDGRVPPNALCTGYSELGENLYTGRATYGGRVVLGKIHGSHGVMYFAHEDKEANVNEYDVLVVKVKEREKAKSEHDALTEPDQPDEDAASTNLRRA